jgi:hypothetical protein
MIATTIERSIVPPVGFEPTIVGLEHRCTVHRATRAYPDLKDQDEKENNEEEDNKAASDIHETLLANTLGDPDDREDDEDNDENIGN